MVNKVYEGRPNIVIKDDIAMVLNTTEGAQGRRRITCAPKQWTKHTTLAASHAVVMAMAGRMQGVGVQRLQG